MLFLIARHLSGNPKALARLAIRIAWMAYRAFSSI